MTTQISMPTAVTTKAKFFNGIQINLTLTPLSIVHIRKANVCCSVCYQSTAIKGNPQSVLSIDLCLKNYTVPLDRTICSSYCCVCNKYLGDSWRLWTCVIALARRTFFLIQTSLTSFSSRWHGQPYITARFKSTVMWCNVSQCCNLLTQQHVSHPVRV